MNGGQKRAFERDGFLVRRNGLYQYLVYAGCPAHEIARVHVNRCTARTQDYAVTMLHNGDMIFPFSSVRKAAEAAVRHMPHVPDYSI